MAEVEIHFTHQELLNSSARIACCPSGETRRSELTNQEKQGNFLPTWRSWQLNNWMSIWRIGLIHRMKFGSQITATTAPPTL